MGGTLLPCPHRRFLPQESPLCRRRPKSSTTTTKVTASTRRTQRKYHSKKFDARVRISKISWRIFGCIPKLRHPHPPVQAIVTTTIPRLPHLHLLLTATTFTVLRVRTIATIPGTVSAARRVTKVSAVCLGTSIRLI